MIQVTVVKTNNTIQSMTIQGHSEYDVKGKDLVCAGVSAISVGGLNAIAELTGKKPQCSMSDGYLFVAFENDAIQQQIAQTILIQLKTIQESYRKYIKITTEK